MPRPMLGNQHDQLKTNSANANTVLSAVRPQTDTIKTIDAKTERLLRKKRSKRYMDALHSLDAGGHTQNQAKIDEIINEIQAEFPEVTISGILLGIVAVCYLGRPYEVHTLDITGNIITHFKAGQALPGELEKARSIALRGGYEFIEVYIDCCRAVSSNGTVSVIKV